MDDRVQQVNWIKEVAGNIRAGGVGDGTPEEQVEFYINEYGVPEWFDDHDRMLLVRFILEN